MRLTGNARSSIISREIIRAQIVYRDKHADDAPEGASHFVYLS